MEKLSTTKYNPSGAVKFAIGLFLLGIGFLFLVVGSSSISAGAKTAQVSMFWLIFAYLFHTMGELCISPVGLSLVNKLSPKRLLGLMFGVWFFASALANYIGGFTASFMDKISEQSSMSSFFLIFVITSGIASLAMLVLAKPIKRWMHGIS
ncbi:MAG: hypothetical protein R2801_10615 [Chitinophagales bacterium]